MDADTLFTGGVQLLLLWLAVTVHESAHARRAQRLGDPTAALLGRTGLNPLRHVEPLGTILFPLLLLFAGAPVFGWGRPTPLVSKNLRRPGWDDVQVLAWGAGANFLLAFFATLGIVVALQVLGPEAREAGFLVLLRRHGEAAGLAGFPVMFTLVQMATINAFLGVFNLIPLPPLDGGQIALHLLPADWGARLAAFRPYGFIIGIALSMLGAVTLVLLPFYGVLSVVINLS
jgi:Zn-dependent protease